MSHNFFHFSRVNHTILELKIEFPVIPAVFLTKLYAGHPPAVGLWLLYLQPLHQPAVLLRRQLPYLVFRSRPLVCTLFQPLIQQDKSIPLPIEALDAVPLSAAQATARALQRLPVAAVLKLRAQVLWLPMKGFPFPGGSTSLPKYCVPHTIPLRSCRCCGSL